MTKQECIKILSAFVRSHLCHNKRAIGYGWCYDLFGTIVYNGKQYGVFSAAFVDNIPEQRGKLFFSCEYNRGCDHVYPLAEELSEEVLNTLIDDNRNGNTMWKKWEVTLNK